MDLETINTVRQQAEKNLNKWGKQDLKTLGLAASEENGELSEAILKHFDEGAEIERIKEEAVDLAAVCLQIIYYLNNPPCALCDRGDGQLGHSEECTKK